MKKIILIVGFALVALNTLSATSVNSRFRSVPISVLRSAFSKFIDDHKADPRVPTPDILKGEPVIVTNDLGMTDLRLGEVLFGFDELAKSEVVIAVASYQTDRDSGTINLRCVFILTGEVLSLKEYKAIVEKPHL